MASIDDADAIQAIYAPIVASTAISFETEPPSTDVIRERIADKLRSLPWIVAEIDGEVIGYAYAAPHRERGAYRWSVETSVYVAAQARQGGVGRRLYRSLVNCLQRQGYVNAFAGIALPNAASVALHEAVGFEPAGTLRAVGFKLGTWHDVGYWRLQLQVPPAKPMSPTPPYAAWI
jgi:phosphinothricin acetyltransferase